MFSTANFFAFAFRSLVFFAFSVLGWIFYPVFLIRKVKKSRYSKNDRLIVNERGDIDEISVIDGASSIDISIVCPAYNEETRLPVMLDATFTFLKLWTVERNLSVEVIVVDDGSKDKTSMVVQTYMSGNSSLRLLKLQKNCGKGGAILRGVHRCRGKFILMADADGATDIRDLSKLYDALIAVLRHSVTLGGCVGAAIGSRAHLEKKAIANRALHRTILMVGLHILVMIFCTRKIRDTQCGFKLFTRETAKLVFPMLHLERWSFDIELIYLMDMLGIPMTEVAVAWEEVPGSKLIQRTSDIIFVSLNMLRDMMCVRLSYALGLWSYNDFKGSL